MATTAAALIIGNEILTGKVPEGNIHLMAQEFFGMGVELARVVICADEIDIIAADINELRANHDVVITTGGVGPTHDDVTIKAVARAFGVGIVRAPEYEKIFRDYHGDKITEAHLRMADVPDGARLAVSDEIAWPTIVMGNVYVFPGVPELFKMKFGLLRKELKTTGGFATRALYLMEDEASLAPLLDRVSGEFTDVNIGSYLFWGPGGDYRTKLTIDGRDAQSVERCFEALRDGVRAGSIVRTE